MFVRSGFVLNEIFLDSRSRIDPVEKLVFSRSLHRFENISTKIIVITYSANFSTNSNSHLVKIMQNITLKV